MRFVALALAFLLTADPAALAQSPEPTPPDTTVQPETTAPPDTLSIPDAAVEPNATVPPDTTATPETPAPPETTAEPPATAPADTTLRADEPPRLEAAPSQEAVVLSGGGSRGIAHVGALVGLKQRGHDPGIVVGTSMGAIVGGLYASGYDPDSIWSLFAAEDWRRIFESRTAAIGPSRALRHPILRFRAGGGETFVARGYIADWRVNRTLVRLLFPPGARAGGDFDRLPRRFRAVAAELDSGKLVSIGSGDLARAVRASMAASGFFAPVEWNGRWLFDGGIADYLPVAEARALGATTVIAVDPLRPPPTPHSLDALAVARRSVDLLVMKVRSGEPDVLILPAVDPGLSPASYPVDPTPLMKSGLEATLAKVEPVEWPPVPRTPRAAPEALGALRIHVPESVLEPIVKKAFGRLAPAAHDTAAILQSADRLYATGLFEGVWPSVEADGGSRFPPDTLAGGPPTLVVRADGQGQTSLGGAVGYDNDRGGRAWASLERVTGLAGWPTEVGIEGTANGVDSWIGPRIRVPLLARHLSAVSAGGFLGESEVRFLPTALDPGDPEVRRAGGWLGADWARFDPDVRAAVAFRVEHILSDVGPDGGSYGPMVRIGATPPLVQDLGLTPGVEAEMRWGTVDYWRLAGRLSFARALGPVDVALLGDGAVASEEAPLDLVPAMGDESLMPALRWGERRGRARGVVGIDALHPGPLKAAIRLRLRGGAVVDELEDDGSYTGGTQAIGGAGLSLYWWTVFGRIETGVEAGTLGDRRFQITVGPDF